MAIEEKPKEPQNSNKKQPKMFVSPKNEKINSEKVINNAEKISEKEEPSVKSDTKNNEENLAQDISFSINQSHEVKNGTNPEKKTRNPSKSPEFEKKSEKHILRKKMRHSVQNPSSSV